MSWTILTGGIRDLAVVDGSRLVTNRDQSPCKDCTRPEKCPGCHDTCKDYRKWKKGIRDVDKARREYLAKPFSKIL